MSALVRYRSDGEGVVISVEGEIDLSNVEEVEAEIAKALDDDARVVIDLTPTAYLDSSGLRLLFGLARTLGERLSILIPEGSHLRRVVATVGLPKVVRVLSDAPGGPQA